MHDDVSDPELMSLLAGGQDSALNELVRRWRGRLCAFLYQMTRDEGTALDLTQETFVRLYRSRDSYRVKGVFQGWLFRIAANLARDHARWRARRPTVPLDDQFTGGMKDAGPSPDEAAVSGEEVALINEALGKLPLPLREALVLFVYQDMGYAEIAEVTGCSPKAAETRIYRARQLLKESLGR